MMFIIKVIVVLIFLYITLDILCAVITLPIIDKIQELIDLLKGDTIDTRFEGEDKEGE